MTLVARIAALSLLTSGLVAALGLTVLTAFTAPGVPSSEYVIPGLVLACVGGIIGAIAGTAREIVAAQRAPLPQAEELSTGTKRRTPRVAAALVLCFLCVVVVWLNARSSANVESFAREAAATNAPADEPPPVLPGTTDAPPPLFDGERRNETGRQPEPVEPANQRVSGEVPPGMSVASVPIDPAFTDNGLIRPGDRVDVFVTSSRVVESQGVSKPVREISTVLENVEVFAVDGNVRDRKTQVVKNVQLLVTTEQARQIKQAGDKGTIHLALRNSNDETSATNDADSEEPEAGRKRQTNAPNIGGRWREAATETDRFAIRPRRNGAGFEIASLDDNQPFEGTVEWSREKGRFEGTATIPKNFKGPIPLVLDPEDGGKKMRVLFSLSEQQRKEMLKHWQEVSEKHRVQEIDSLKEQEEALIASVHQVWVRDSVGFPPISSLPAEPATAAPRLTVSAIPDTPAAKRLAEQLGTQESAAAAEAATIRQLQANGQAEQNRQAIAEHQRKLKNLLSTAFDLKLQWEELQVQELQSRLSRLERQIGQRKELREKIINRRAGELIEGDALRWDSTAPASTKLPGSAVGNTKKTATPEVVAILRERLDLLWADMLNGTAKPDAVLRALNELAQAEPPEAHEQHVERLQALLEEVRGAQGSHVSKAEVLEIEAAYEKARSSAPTARPIAGLTTKASREDERTFDGTPYSQWLKMLETERKPDKLATAMEACARLAATGDERRIARGLFVAAKLFESTDNTKERNLVWDAGTAALKRLPGEAVVAELLAALHDEQFQDAREFQCRFLISVATSSKTSLPDRLKAAFKLHDQELVTTLLKMAQPTEDRNNRLLAGAASVWLISERKLGEFDGLPPLVMAAIDEVYSRTTGRIDRREQPWLSASSRLVSTEPETPGLAILLAKHINQDRTQIAGRLRDMGAHAEPAVPLLIEDFLVHWKNRETELRHSAASDAESAAERFLDAYGDVPLSEEERMVQVLNVLGAIGPKAKSAVPLLRQIAVLAPPKRGGTPSLNDRLFDAVKKSLSLIGDAPAAEAQEAPNLLSEFARLQGCWNLLSLTPNADHKDIQFEFDWQLSIEDKHVQGHFEVVTKVMNHIGVNSSGMLYRINDTVTPRQIELIDKKQRHRQLGIYELKDDRLKIELAKPGRPRPKEFSADPNKLPEGHVLLELGRAS